MKILILILFACIIYANSLREYNMTSVCKNIDIEFQVNPAKILGEWYPIAVSKRTNDYDCKKLNITHVSGMKCRWEFFNYKTEESKSFTLTLSNKYNIFISQLSEKTKVFTIVDTDYYSHLCVIQCTVKRNKPKYVVFIYSRTDSLPEKTLLDLIKNISIKFGEEIKFYLVDHGKCINN